MGPLIDAVLSLVDALADTDRERAWHPLKVVGYALLAVVAGALVAVWLTS